MADDVVTPGLADCSLTGGLWQQQWSRHEQHALDHQWEQLERTGAIECFRIVAGRSTAPRSAHFTSDSDVYKWLDAASRALAQDPSPVLVARVEELVELVEAAQASDGYLNTWIQACFPADRFQNLELEHEHYCLGHLIEAGVSHHQATGSSRLLEVARRAADLLVREFAEAPAHRVDGHEEIEIALVRLHRCTGEDAYLELARRFLERRGTAPHPGRRMAASAVRTARHYAARTRQVRAHARANPTWAAPPVPNSVEVAHPPSLALRVLRDSLSGREFQTDRPVREQVEPSGHAVRWLYLQTAATMLARELGDPTLGASVERAWDAYVHGHLFVNGGSGALPMIEGFADPFELDPELAYAETCAALAGTFWNRELGLLTGDARYDDLLEWQLLNGAAVGMSLDGATYSYNNPLRVAPGFARQPWFAIPCCPSNLSRTWASLATLQWTLVDDELRLHQFFSSSARLGGASVEVTSELPWAGGVDVRIDPGLDGPRVLAVRVPSWAEGVTVALDGRPVDVEVPDRPAPTVTASGLDPRQARWCRLDLPASDAPCTVRLELTVGVRFLRQDPRVPKVGGRVAVARGPVLYALEGVDHPGLTASQLTELELDPASVVPVPEPDLLGGVVTLQGATPVRRPLRFVPYALWGNRGATGMTPFVRLAGAPLP